MLYEVITRGIPASPGVAIGKGVFLSRELPRSVLSIVPKEKVEEEVEAFLLAVNRSREQIHSIRQEIADPSAETYQILSAHLALLEDSMMVSYNFV